MTSFAALSKAGNLGESLQLWIDGCGGFALLPGVCWSVGGAGEPSAVDVAVQADWPRRAGKIQREDTDYFWETDDGCRMLLHPPMTVPIPGSACLTLHRPSPLSRSASLRITPPHRFVGHVDQVILVADSVLIGPSSACHIHCRQLSQRWILTPNGQDLRLHGPAGEPAREIRQGVRIEIDQMAMRFEAR